MKIKYIYNIIKRELVERKIVQQLTSLTKSMSLTSVDAKLPLSLPQACSSPSATEGNVFESINDHIPNIALKILSGSTTTKDLSSFFSLFRHNKKQEILTGNWKLVSKILQIVQGDIIKLPVHWQRILREIGRTIFTLDLGTCSPGLTQVQFNRLQKSFPFVQKLRVKNSLTEIDLRLEKWKKTLKQLVLDDNCVALNQAVLPYLRYFTRLKALSLKNCAQILDLTPFGGLTKLVSLQLTGCKSLVAHSLSVLKNLKNLKVLAADKIATSSLVHLTEAPSLTHLSLSILSPKAEPAQQELNLPVKRNSLENLVLQHENLTIFEFTKIVKMQQKLRLLNLSNSCLVDDFYLESVGSLIHLEELNLSYTAVSGMGLEYLRKNPSLTSLKLDHCDWLRCFAILPQVRHLSIRRFLNSTPLFHDKEEINLAIHFPNLTSVDLSYQNHASMMLTHLPRQLKDIKLKECKNLTGKDLYPLQRLTTLRTLDLMGCNKIDDSSYLQLKVLTQLRYLNLTYTRISKKIAELLRKELKHTLIDHAVCDFSPAMLRNLWKDRLA
jgi:hypothetical protein